MANVAEKAALFLILLVLISGCAAGGHVSAPTASQLTAAPAALSDASSLYCAEWESLSQGGCTVVYATDGEQMFGGNNEDASGPLAKVWFIPPEPGKYGRVYFGFENYLAQGGMNDQGLFYDLLTVDPRTIPIEGKQLYEGINFYDYVLSKCADVDCVVKMFEQYYEYETWNWQHLFGDATGESAIIEARATLRQRGGFQVATNFSQSGTPPEKRTCWRYQTATKMLEGSPALSVEYMRDVMAAVHQANADAATVYTGIYDLKNRKIYLYYLFDYEHAAVIDLEEELAMGAHAYDLPALFPPNPAAQKWSAAKVGNYNYVIRSRRKEIDPAFLAAYTGYYELPEDVPDNWVHVERYGDSLMMSYADAHGYELFPQSETSFFAVTWAKDKLRFQVRFDVKFGVDAAGQVTYMDLVFGAGTNNYLRFNRTGAASFVPYISTPIPTAGPSAAPAAAVTTTPAPASSSGFQWGWAIALAAFLAVAAGCAVILYRRRSARG